MTFLKNKKTKIAFGIILLLFGLDALIITPYAISNFSATETNPVHQFGFETFGVKYTYIAFPFWVLLLFFTFNTGQKLLDVRLKSKGKKDKDYIFKAMIFLIVLQSTFIMLNLIQIFNVLKT